MATVIAAALEHDGIAPSVEPTDGGGWIVRFRTADAIGLAIASLQGLVERALTLESPSEEAYLDRLFRSRDDAQAGPDEPVMLMPVVTADASTFWKFVTVVRSLVVWSASPRATVAAAFITSVLVPVPPSIEFSVP